MAAEGGLLCSSLWSKEKLVDFIDKRLTGYFWKEHAYFEKYFNAKISRRIKKRLTIELE